jgi:hypothetical protein
MATNPRAGAPPEEGGDDEFDLQQLKEVVGFLLRAPRRRPRLAIATLVLTLTIGVLLAKYSPRTFACDVRILAQRNLVLPALDNPGRAVPHDADAPTKNAADAILRRDNLVALTKQLDLVDRWEATRQPALRFKDSFSGARNDDERLRDMIALLGKGLAVLCDESSITISIEWPDREMAFDIVSLVQKNFLEARYDANVNVIVEAIRILDERAKPQAAEVDAALADLMKIEADRSGAGVAPALPVVPPMPSPGAAPSPRPAPSPVPTSAATAAAPSGDSDVAHELQDIRRRIRAVTEDHERQVADAQRQLVDARATLGPMHPTVLGLNEKIAQLGETPPELKTLDARERELVAQLATPSAAPSATGTDALPPPRRAAQYSAPAPAATRPVAMRPIDLRDDSRTVLARQRLTMASTKYNELLSRIESANIELEVTRAAFKYQYTVVRPPEVPRGPSKPNVVLLLVGSLFLSILLMVLVPGGVDLWRGRLMEPWQVERRLKLPILGDMTAPP